MSTAKTCWKIFPIADIFVTKCALDSDILGII